MQDRKQPFSNENILGNRVFTWIAADDDKKTFSAGFAEHEGKWVLSTAGSTNLI